jgi:hypothetical protein
MPKQVDDFEFAKYLLDSSKSSSGKLQTKLLDESYEMLLRLADKGS